MDYVTVDGLKIRGVHGHHEHERRVEQEFEVSLKVGCDIGAAGQSDKLPDTIDFDFLRGVVEKIFASKSYYLVEALANDIATAILEDVRAKEAIVSIKKTAVWPDATPGVIITRSR
jgi:dihydroneopterin aldolase